VHAEWFRMTYWSSWLDGRLHLKAIRGNSINVGRLAMGARKTDDERSVQVKVAQPKDG
jgi:hypothetical protein